MMAPHRVNAVERKYAGHTIKVVGNGGTCTYFLIDNREAGVCISIYDIPMFSQGYIREFDTILYDMFNGWRGDKHVDVVYYVLYLYNTVATGFSGCFRDNVKFIFIDNHISLNNVYFSALGMLDNLEPGSRYCVDPEGLYLLELATNGCFVNENSADIVEYNRIRRRYKPYVDFLRRKIKHKE